MRLRHLREQAFTILPADGPDIDVGPGEEFDVEDELGRSLLDQPDNYAPADDAARSAVDQAEEARSLVDTIDDMHVGEVLPLLDALDQAALEEVRETEEAGKARVTVLNRIDELLAEAGVTTAGAAGEED